MSPTNSSGQALRVSTPITCPSGVVPMRTSMLGKGNPERRRSDTRARPMSETLLLAALAGCASGRRGGHSAEVERVCGQGPGHRAARRVDVGEPNAAVDAVRATAVVV